MISVCASMSQIEEQREEIGSGCYYRCLFIFLYIYNLQLLHLINDV